MAQLIDPFIPLQSRTKHHPYKVPAGPYGQKFLKKPSSPLPRRLRTPVQAISHQSQHEQGLIDGIIHTRRPALRHDTVAVSGGSSSDLHARSAVTRFRPAVFTRREGRPGTAKPQSVHHRRAAGRRLGRTMQLPVLAALAIVLGLSSQFLIFGELAIGIYAVMALARRVSSRTTFTLAMLSLVGIMVSSFVRGSSTQTNNFAVYTFLLMVVGTISLVLEVNRSAV